jgi:hypothetical protein
MSRQTVVSASLVCVLTVLGVFLVGGQALAGSLIRDAAPTSSTFINSGSLIVPGTYVVFSGRSEPWVVQAFAQVGECVRFDQAAPFGGFGGGSDLEITVIAPNGTVFRNDDRAGSSDPRALVKIAGAPNTGYYTVQVSHFGGAGFSTDFTLVYGRFTPASNPNCSSPTPGVDSDSAAGKGE